MKYKENRRVVSDLDGGKIYKIRRNLGYFTDGNPYITLAANTRRKQNKDAYWDKAVEWEADQKQLVEQRAYDKEVLAEQREYDSPIAEKTRMIEAGYNPDLMNASGGSVSSGSSAQLAHTEMNDPSQATVEPANYYADRELATSGVNAAANFIGSISSALSTIVTGVSTMRMLPSQLELASSTSNMQNAQAGLSSAQATEINQLLDGKKTAQSLSLGTDIFGKLMDFGFGADSDISSFLNVAGIPSEKHGDISSAFKEIMKNPSAVAMYQRSKMSADKANADASVFNSDYFVRMAEGTRDLQELQLDFDTLRTSISRNIQSYLASSGYAEDTANAMIVGADNQRTSSEFAKDCLERDLKVYFERLDVIKAKVIAAQKRRVELMDKRLTEGKLSLREQNELTYINDAIPMMETLGSQELGSVFSISSQLNRNAYLSQNASSNLNGKDVSLQDLSLYWNSYVSGAKSSHDIAQDWINSVIRAGAVLVGAYAAKNGAVPQPTGQVIEDMEPGYDGTMQTTRRRTTQNVY